VGGREEKKTFEKPWHTLPHFYGGWIGGGTANPAIFIVKTGACRPP